MDDGRTGILTLPSPNAPHLSHGKCDRHVQGWCNHLRGCCLTTLPKEALQGMGKNDQRRLTFFSHRHSEC